MTHTPGPWSVDDFDKMQVIAGDRRVCRTENVDNPFEACEANARLIAAAPDLLSTLMIVRENLVRLAWEENSLMISAIDAAISKATHKPQEV